MSSKLFRIIVFMWKFTPFKKGIRPLICLFPSFKNKVYKDFRYNGVMNVNYNGIRFKLYNPGFTTIENEIFWNGLERGWEQKSLKLWSALSRNASVVLDIGANTGVYSFLAAAVNPNAKVIAFEPVHRTAEIFRKNLKLNGSEVVLHQVAVSNISAKAMFYDVDSESQYSASLNSKMLEGQKNRISYEVDVVKLDDFFHKDIKIDLIKLDVELHEPEAITGMINLIHRNKPSILIEVLTDEVALKLAISLKDMNYLYYSIDEKSEPKQLQSIQKSDFYNILLISADKLLQVGLVDNNV